jgi:hypothetical protein
MSKEVDGKSVADLKAEPGYLRTIDVKVKDAAGYGSAPPSWQPREPRHRRGAPRAARADHAQEVRPDRLEHVADDVEGFAAWVDRQ